jgi:hypothetical protein
MRDRDDGLAFCTGKGTRMEEGKLRQNGCCLGEMELPTPVEWLPSWEVLDQGLYHRAECA